MTTKRAFNVLEQRNTNENQHIGKTPLIGKNEPRAPFKLALKDLTNNSSSRSNFAIKSQEPTTKKPLQQKSIASSALHRKKSPESIAQQTTKKQLPFTIFTPHDAEYNRGKEACLREDLLEQMIEFTGSVYKREIKPMKPLRVQQLELPEFDVPQKTPKSATTPKDLPSNFLFSLPEVELPDLDFML
ncbi:uncharacterized protein LOC131681884 [Topomyia yanbarensis]|uniref:uncharacterized protein LOC131681884 n=1 Tax=Topomyia yanbarensis TaxID=2498891 RepID=UPI00273B14B7|nr:uncharacterized protein LOC131681884 [Topomyia yanbarensis]